MTDGLLVRTTKNILAYFWVAIGNRFFRGRSFQGYWEDRIATLFELDVDFSGASVLDVGCNMGIVGLEVCKHGPAKYHGIEKMVVHSFIAQCVLQGTRTESHVDLIDLGSKKDREKTLDTEYDVVLYLAVHQHLKKQIGHDAAASVMTELFNRCKSQFVFLGPDLDEAIRIAASKGFTPVKSVPQGKLNPACHFVRN